MNDTDKTTLMALYEKYGYQAVADQIGGWRHVENSMRTTTPIFQEKDHQAILDAHENSTRTTGARCGSCGKTVAACNEEKDAIQEHNERGGL